VAEVTSLREIRRSRSAYHHVLALTCMGKTGQLLTYTDNQRTAGMPQLRTYRLKENSDPKAAAKLNPLC